jgi:hypothetical protein
MRLKFIILFGFIALTGLLAPVHAATRVVMCEEFYMAS